MSPPRLFWLALFFAGMAQAGNGEQITNQSSGRTRIDLAPTGGRMRSFDQNCSSPLEPDGCAKPSVDGSSRRVEPGAQQILQTSSLAGFQYHAGRALFPLMQTGDRLTLRREPDNPIDPRAVRIEWFGIQIGYAPRADNVDLARLMDRGMAVEGRILHLQKSRNPWQRVLVEIYVADGQRAAR